MKTPPPLPQPRPRPLPTLTVDIPKGITRPIIAVLVTIVLADYLFLFHAPGLSIGVFGLFLGLLILGTRTKPPTGIWHWSAFLLLGLSCAQSVRFLSLSNTIALTVLLLCLSGFSAHTKLEKAWQRWCDGLLAILKPIATLHTFQILVQHIEKKKPTGDTGFETGLPSCFQRSFCCLSSDGC